LDLVLLFICLKYVAKRSKILTMGETD
jgi:hypothetical protein